ncbi:hypothetical protein HPP92_018898 [Vanilla planifolia]|uniref:Uncharacterized protein n=1 Tax=Vanilla planifolia TaxID=51239 RepID=A0A835Q326_VANPL|nr:hypothetical protein HPP92_018898 [Vanilla planifolia]
MECRGSKDKQHEFNENNSEENRFGGVDVKKGKEQESSEVMVHSQNTMWDYYCWWVYGCLHGHVIDVSSEIKRMVGFMNWRCSSKFIPQTLILLSHCYFSLKSSPTHRSTRFRATNS